MKTISLKQLILILFATINMSAHATSYFKAELTQLPTDWCAPSLNCLDGQYYMHASPKGLILFLHGTGGSKNFIDQINGSMYSNEAINRGYSILSLSAADGYQWKQDEKEKLIDAIEFLQYKYTQLTENTPLYMIGHSQGGGIASELSELKLSDPGFFSAQVLTSVEGKYSVFNNENIASSVPPTRWVCGINDSIKNYNRCENFYNSFQEFTECENCSLSSLEIYGKSELSPVSFEQIAGINKSLSLQIWNSFNSSICDNSILNHTFKLKINPKLEFSTVENCLNENNINLSFIQRKDLRKLLEMYYAEHAMNNLQESVEKTFDWLASVAPKDVRKIVPTKASSLAGYWKFDGNFLNEVKEDSVISLYGSTQLSNNTNVGPTVLSVDGSQDYEELRQQDLKTIAMWVKKVGDSGNGNGHSFPIRKGNDWDKNQISIRINDGEKSQVTCNMAQPSKDHALRVHKNGGVIQGEWIHIACVIDDNSKTMSLYINGIKKAEGVFDELPNNSSDPLTIGGNRHYNNFNGLIDEVAIYNVPLSSDEILQIYNEQKNH